MAKSIMRIACLFVLFCYAALSMAEDFADPTRPPNLSASLDTPTSQVSAVPTATGLQSILLSGSRRAAIIDGKTVELGQLYGNARLVEINGSSVVLVNAQGRRVLKLFPDIKITRKANEVAPNEVLNHPLSSVERKEKK